MEKVHKESQNKEKADENNQPQSIAERLLQQCLIPVPVQPLPASKVSNNSILTSKESDSASLKRPDSNYMNNNIQNNWFKCKICQKTEQTSRLLYHASHAHNIQDISVASRECVTSSSNNKAVANNNNDTFKFSHNNISNSPSMDFHGIAGSHASMSDDYSRMNGMRHNNENHHSMNSPPWCEGAFPSDLEDVALSPPSSYNGNHLMGIDHGNLNCGVGFSNIEDMNSSSCSPPSVGDLTSLNPQDHFDPDFDVVDEMKFIDCLIQTIEPTPDNNISESNNNSELNHIPLSNSAMDQGAHDDAVSSEEDTKPTVTEHISHNNNSNRSPLQSSVENNSIKSSQLQTQSHGMASAHSALRQYPKLGGIVGGGSSNGGIYPTPAPSCMLIGGPNQSHNHISPLNSPFKFGHSNTINVSFSNSKILFPHHQQNSVVLPPPMPAFMHLPSNSSSRMNSGHQPSNPFGNTTLKPPVNTVSSNNDFILNKMSNIPSTAANGNFKLFQQ
jgi:hypothetical protein